MAEGEKKETAIPREARPGHDLDATVGTLKLGELLTALEANRASAAVGILPEHYKPEQRKPEYYKPEQLKPEHYKPEHYKPEQIKPEYYKPEQIKPEYYKPEQLKPEQRKPEQLKPEQLKPEQLKPEQLKPEQFKPEQLKPEQLKSSEMLTEIPTEMSAELFQPGGSLSGYRRMASVAEQQASDSHSARLAADVAALHERINHLEARLISAIEALAQRMGDGQQK